MILPGCGTLAPTINDDLTRQKPTEAFSDCGSLTNLPGSLPEMELSGAVTLILEAHLEDITIFQECKRKHEALRDWIKAE